MARRIAVWLVSLNCMGFAQVASAATDDVPPDLPPSVEVAPRTAPSRSLKLFGELAFGRMQQRYGLGADDTRRASLDLAWGMALSPSMRAVLSDRIDHTHPTEEGAGATVNSLREAYLAWQDEAGRWSLDIGRVNYRNGPAYGFNPTDFLRDGTSRVLTTVDPLALRENRLGTAMAKVQYLGDGHSLTLVFAPKLANQASDRTWSMDWGATNRTDRVLAVWGGQASVGLNFQALLFRERGRGTQLGANASALIGDSVVTFAEWTSGRDEALSVDSSAVPSRNRSAQRAALGATYTTPWRMAITAEYEYNGFALTKSQWVAAVTQSGVETLLPYQATVQWRQDIASRNAALVYVSQRDAFAKNVELTGLIRFNLDDKSRFVWVEARYHLPKVDIALQWQANMGRSTTEFGAQPVRHLLQMLVAAYY